MSRVILMTDHLAAVFNGGMFGAKNKVIPARQHSFALYMICSKQGLLRATCGSEFGLPPTQAAAFFRWHAINNPSQILQSKQYYRVNSEHESSEPFCLGGYKSDCFMEIYADLVTSFE